MVSDGRGRHSEVLAAHLRARVVEAARELFTERGYQGTTTKEIALRAGVSEPTLFKYFGSKANLFEVIVAEPLQDWASSLSTYWQDLPLEQIIERYMGELYDVVYGHRALLRPLMAASLDSGRSLEEVAKRVSSEFAEGLATIVAAGRDLAKDRDLPRIDYASALSIEISMILGTVLLEDWVFPAGAARPGRDRLIGEMTRLLTGGFMSVGAAGSDHDA